MNSYERIEKKGDETFIRIPRRRVSQRPPVICRGAYEIVEDEGGGGDALGRLDEASSAVIRK